MWLVQTLLSDHWFDDFDEAYAAWQASPKLRTFPKLDSDWPKSPGAFQAVSRRAA